MQTKNAIGNLWSRYKAVLRKCMLMNVFGSMAVIGMFVVGSACVANAANETDWTVGGDISYDAATTITTGGDITSLNIALAGVLPGQQLNGSVVFNASGESTISETVNINEGRFVLNNGAATINAMGLTTIGTTGEAGGTLNISSGKYNADDGIDFVKGSILLGNSGSELNVTTGDITVASGSSIKTGAGSINMNNGNITVESGGILELGAAPTSLGVASVIANKINMAGAMTVRSDLTIDANLNIESGATLTLPDAGIDLTISKKLTTSIDLTIDANSSLRAGGIKTFKGDITIDGKLILQGADHTWGAVTISKVGDTDDLTPEIILGDSGFIFAGAVTLSQNFGDIKQELTVSTLKTTDGKVTLDGATANLIFRAEAEGSTLGIKEITVNDSSTLTLGEANNNAIVTSATTDIILNGTLAIDGGQFTLNDLTTTSTASIEGSSNLAHGAGVLDLTTLNVNGATSIDGGTFDIDDLNLASGANLTITDGYVTVDNTITRADSTVNVSGGILDMTSLNEIQLDDFVQSKINITANGSLIFDDYFTTANTFTSAASAGSGSIQISDGSFIVDGTLTLSDTTTSGVIALGTSGSAIKADTLVLNSGATGDNGGSLNITKGSLVVLGDGSATALKGTSITLTGATTADATLTLGSGGGTTATKINATKGNVLVEGIWNLGTVGAMTLGADSSLNVSDGSLKVDTVTVDATNGSIINVTNGSLNVNTLNLLSTTASILTLNNGNVLINSTTAGDFTNSASGVVLNNVSKLTADADLILDVTTGGLATNVTKFTGDGTSTIHLKGDFAFADSTANAMIAAGNIIDDGFVAFDDVILPVRDASLIGHHAPDIQGLDVSNQSGANSSNLVSGTGFTAISGFAAAGIVESNAGISTIGSGFTKLIGNKPVGEHSSLNVTGSTTGVATLVLTGGTSDSKLLGTFTLTTETSGTNLIFDGIYKIHMIEGNAGAVNSNSVTTLVGSDLTITTLKLATLKPVTYANVTIGTLNQAVATFDSGAKAIIKDIDNSVTSGTALASTLAVNDGAMAFYGTTVAGTTGIDWIETAMKNAMIGNDYDIDDNDIDDNDDENDTDNDNDDMPYTNHAEKAIFGVSRTALVLNGAIGNLEADTILNVDGANTTAGTAAFGANSLFVVDATLFTGDNAPYALTADTITVADGAQLLITDVKLDEDNTATIHVVDADATITGTGWGNTNVDDPVASNNLIFDSAFLAGNTFYDVTGKKVSVDVRKVAASSVVGEDLDDSLGDLIDSVPSPPQFVEDAVNNGGSVVIEGAAKLGTVAAIAPILSSVGNSGINNMQARNSIIGVASVAALNYEGGTTTLVAASDGIDMNTGFGLWAMPMYQMQTVKDLKSGNFNYGYDTDFYGVSIGVDYTVDMNSDSAFRVGLAFNTGMGSTESSGDFADVKNDFTYYGAGVYATYQLNGFGITADAGYTMSTNEIDNTALASTLSANPNANLMSVGLRGEYFISTPILDIIPYVGARWNVSIVDAYTSKYGLQGQSTFVTEEQTTSVIEVPVGISIREDFETIGGFSFSPKLDLGAKFAFGDIENEQKVSFVDSNYTASMTSEAMDAITLQGGFGIAMNFGDSMTFDIDYKLDIGTTLINHGAFATLRYNF